MSEKNIDYLINEEKKGMLRDTYTTALNKAKYASLIRSGLGEEIKNSSKKPIIIHKTKWEKFKIWLLKLFIKF